MPGWGPMVAEVGWRAQQQRSGTISVSSFGLLRRDQLGSGRMLLEGVQRGPGRELPGALQRELEPSRAGHGESVGQRLQPGHPARSYSPHACR